MIFLLSLLSRVVFTAIALDHFTIQSLARALPRAFLFDLVVCTYVFMPFAILSFLPSKVWEHKRFQQFLFGLFFLAAIVFGLATISEGFFVEEFHSRYNFIAVDYLVYTNEVLKNIWESYPLGWILPILFLAIFLFSRFLFRKLQTNKKISYIKSLSLGTCLLVMSILFFLFLRENPLLDGMDTKEAELSKNSLHTLFAAYRNNEIDYKRFYNTLEEKRSISLVNEALSAESPIAPGSIEDKNSLVRHIVRSGSPKKLNVVIVLMESMSATFMKSFGYDKNITPNLDRLAQNGLFFDRLYSTGTRTVRGIEAVTLSLPPTPGQSIVRRPEGGGLFNIGTVFRNYGYQTQFIYGGNAFFDNMGEFFSSNGFTVLDKPKMQKDEITFANAWGVCDEDIFRFAIKNADQVIAEKKPFFQFILTTSNHRPYTFPEGKIDLPPLKGGRDAAVKYSDFSIGKYLEEAKDKPWFKDTIFIFVADHQASVAGVNFIQPYDYHIPLIFYSPAHIKPEKKSILGSQIDLAPTLFGLLNFSYQSKFFGHDLLKAKAERVFLATYQKVGLWKDNKLVMLSPNRRIEISEVKGEIASKPSTYSVASRAQKYDDKMVETTISYYEAASEWFSQKLLKENNVAPNNTNNRSY